MSNFTCPTCGVTSYDCGKDGYKTACEIELEKKLEIAVEALNKIVNYNSVAEQIDKYYHIVIDVREIGNEALAKIKEIIDNIEIQIEFARTKVKQIYNHADEYMKGKD